MRIKVLLAICCLSLALGGVEYFPYDLKLEWVFPDSETVEFRYHISEKVYTTWAWAGFGIKEADEEDLSMGHSDLVTLQWYPHGVQDRWGVGELYPKLDTARGGTSDVILDEEFEEGEDYVRIYTMTRKLDTGDEFDTLLVKDKPYIIMWAIGQNYQDKPIAHTMWNRGREFMLFSEDYLDNGSDDFYGDGGYYGNKPDYDRGDLEDLAAQMLYKG